MSLSDDFLSALNEPAATTRNGLTVGVSPTQRLAMAMRNADASADDSGVQKPWGSRWTDDPAGIPNPYGTGLDAYEPATLMLDAYKTAKGESDASQPQAEDFPLGAPLVPSQAADGQVASFINAALGLASKRTPYAWGGTSANGVDCSGLIYYAARAAGIKLNGGDWPRLRAIDYGSLGEAVSAQDARPGDLVYYDNPGTTTDHVGIYIGNGMVVQAPQSGDVVRITPVGRATSYRRVFQDTSFGQTVLATGQITTAYNGSAYNPGQNVGGPGQAPGSTIIPDHAPVFGILPGLNKHGTGGTMKAI
jgi:hypothetical protein